MKIVRLLFATSLAAAAACHKNPPPQLPASSIPETPASQVESVVFIVGDMGDAILDRSPLPNHLQSQVEMWSRALHRDSSVAVLFLGDNVYPKGLRTEPAFFATDSAHMQAQVDIVSGPQARANHSFGVFIAGNHDWGHMPGQKGEDRLRNEQDFLARRRTQGIGVELLPAAGTPGPGIVDVGRRMRFLLLDTAWWLLSADKAEKERTYNRLVKQLAQAKADNREVVLAAHHPLKSAGAHGGLISLWKGVGVTWLLNRSGAALQDLNSLPYRDLLAKLTSAFQLSGAPLIFAGGHDHTLQVMKATKPDDPGYILVSGAGSKSSQIGSQSGMMFRSTDTGYMRIVVKKDGGVDLFVVSTPHQYMICNTGTEQEQQQCLREGVAHFETNYSVRLK